ncbi:hypothetical protein [uncultured Bradyrhizobium sp.]
MAGTSPAMTAELSFMLFSQSSDRTLIFVMPGLVPGIHVLTVLKQQE